MTRQRFTVVLIVLVVLLAAACAGRPGLDIAMPASSAPQHLSWESRIALSDLYAADPQTAVTPDGTVHVVWAQRTSGTSWASSVVHRQFSNGLWSSPETVRPPAPEALHPRLAADGWGRLHLIWSETQPCVAPYGLCPTRVFYSTPTEGSAWTLPQELTEILHLTQAPEAMVAGQDGTLHIAWSEDPYRPHDSVWYAQRRPDGTWLPPEEVFRPERGAPAGSVASGPRPSMALDAKGTVFMVWGDNASGSGVTYFAQRASKGGWSKPQVVFKFEPSVSEPLLARLGNGGLALLVGLTWSGTGSSPSQHTKTAIFFLSRTPGGTWSPPQTVRNTGAYAEDAAFPAFAVDIEHLYAVWSSYLDRQSFSTVSPARRPQWSPPEALPLLPNEFVFGKKLAVIGDQEVLLIAASTTQGDIAKVQIVAMSGHLVSEQPAVTPTPDPTLTSAPRQ